MSDYKSKLFKDSSGQVHRCCTEKDENGILLMRSIHSSVAISHSVHYSVVDKEYVKINKS